MDRFSARTVSGKAHEQQEHPQTRDVARASVSKPETRTQWRRTDDSRNDFDDLNDDDDDGDDVFKRLSHDRVAASHKQLKHDTLHASHRKPRGRNTNRTRDEILGMAQDIAHSGPEDGHKKMSGKVAGAQAGRRADSALHKRSSTGFGTPFASLPTLQRMPNAGPEVAELPGATRIPSSRDGVTGTDTTSGLHSSRPHQDACRSVVVPCTGGRSASTRQLPWGPGTSVPGQLALRLNPTETQLAKSGSEGRCGKGDKGLSRPGSIVSPLQPNISAAPINNRLQSSLMPNLKVAPSLKASVTTTEHASRSLYDTIIQLPYEWQQSHFAELLDECWDVVFYKDSDKFEWSAVCILQIKDAVKSGEVPGATANAICEDDSLPVLSLLDSYQKKLELACLVASEGPGVLRNVHPALPEHPCEDDYDIHSAANDLGMPPDAVGGDESHPVALAPSLHEREAILGNLRPFLTEHLEENLTAILGLGVRAKTSHVDQTVNGTDGGSFPNLVVATSSGSQSAPIHMASQQEERQHELEELEEEIRGEMHDTVPRLVFRITPWESIKCEPYVPEPALHDEGTDLLDCGGDSVGGCTAYAREGQQADTLDDLDDADLYG